MDDEIIKEYCLIIKNKIAQSDFLSAIRSADKLLYNFPNYEYGYYFKAVCYFALEKYEDAIKNYKTAIELNPGFGKAYFNLGICYNTIKKTDLALLNVGKALVVFSKLKELDAKEKCIEALRFIQAERNR